ncbi:hypothetical protein N1851_006948 [Merluccius polli]|uniref:DUF6729 domain-containing protein n=1 Tax=Merluccius polli TaxID=89951 RepID=A0AA47N3U7_MERPO|nr:hypothetical protein N1851_006948 [Merluccius polli]
MLQLQSASQPRRRHQTSVSKMLLLLPLPQYLRWHQQLRVAHHFFLHLPLLLLQQHQHRGSQSLCALQRIAHILYEASGQLRQEVSQNWHHPPSPIRSVAPPNPHDYFRQRMFLWAPMRMWSIPLKCPQCNRKMHHSGIYTKVREVIDVDLRYNLIGGDYPRCSQCKPAQTFCPWSSEILKQLDPSNRNKFPAVLILLIFIDVKMTGRGRGRRDALAIAVQTQSGQEEAEELVNGAAGGRGTEAEGREPTLSDLAAILQTHMGQQQARDEEQRELAEKQERRFKALQQQFQVLQTELQARTTPTPDPPPAGRPAEPSQDFEEVHLPVQRVLLLLLLVFCLLLLGHPVRPGKKDPGREAQPLNGGRV